MRMLHTMLRVGDLEASKKFSTEALGMKVLREESVIGFLEDPTGYRIALIERS